VASVPESKEFVVTQALFEHHREMLKNAQRTIESRTFWSAFAEVPSGKIYGETAKADGLAAFERRLDHSFKIDQPGDGEFVGDESSPYGISLDVSYPHSDLNTLVSAAMAAGAGWARASIEARVGVCLEILHRLNRRSFELAYAVMHTTGQGFMMAFQAGGPHAQDRGLEAVAFAYDEMKRTPQRAIWEKQVSKTDVVRLEKTFRLIPRGVAAVVGCSTFPTWNGYPGMFASLATGNAVVVKPHPEAILPLAITVEIARDVLSESGFDANVVTLAADTTESPVTEKLVTHPDVRIVDYTGGSAFGNWVEGHAKQAFVCTEKAGVNSVIVDSVEDLRAVAGNLAFSVSLYSGQMCTTPQNIFIPSQGIVAGGSRKSFSEVADALVGAIDWLLSDPKRAAEILGAIQSDRTLDRVGGAGAAGGTVLRESSAVANERFPGARVRSPMVVTVSADRKDLFAREVFGPIVYLVETADTAESIALAAASARSHGAITCGIYSTSAAVLTNAIDAMTSAGAAVSCNLTGQIFVNQSAAFSDFHVSGANPAGNATLCDRAFVASRFRIVQSRRQVS